jgi:hypothetical protein
MSISIYYGGKRKQPLSENERAAVGSILRRFAVDDHIEKWKRSGEGLNWASFLVYDKPSAPTVIFEGATQLPDNSADAVQTGLGRWCAALSEIRRVVPGAEWQVAVDDQIIRWDAKSVRYIPRI